MRTVPSGIQKARLTGCTVPSGIQKARLTGCTVPSGIQKARLTGCTVASGFPKVQSGIRAREGVPKKPLMKKLAGLYVGGRSRSVDDIR